MEIKFSSLSNIYTSHRCFAPLNPVQKRVVLLAMIALSCASLFAYVVTRYCPFKVQKIPSQNLEKKVQKVAQEQLKQKAPKQKSFPVISQEIFTTPCPPKKEKVLREKEKAFQNDQKELKDKILSECETVDKIPKISKENSSDSIDNSIDIVEKWVKKLLNNEDLFAGTINYSNLNEALKTLFRAAIDKQFDQNEKNRQRIIDVLVVFEKEQHEFIHDKKIGILSLAMCFLNYLTQEIPEEIKKLPYWHNESLILAALDEKVSQKIPFAKILIKLASNAVSKQLDEGFYYLLRPSTSLADSTSNSPIFTVTFRQESELMPEFIWQQRIETVKDSDNQACLFREVDSQGKGVTIENFIKKLAGELPLIPILVPSTSVERKATYFLD